jgi:hypothetical protein
MYAPSRDFAHNYPKMVQMVINCFNQDYWPELFAVYTRWALAENLWCDGRAFSELEKAKDIYCRFLNECCKDPDECCDDVLERVGWAEVPPAVQATWLAMLGQVVTGQLFAGIRDLHMRPDGTDPAEIAVLLEAGQDARRAMNRINKGAETQLDAEAVFRESARRARAKGLDDDAIARLLDDVKYGRVSPEQDAQRASVRQIYGGTR